MDFSNLMSKKKSSQEVSFSIEIKEAIERYSKRISLPSIKSELIAILKGLDLDSERIILADPHSHKLHINAIAVNSIRSSFFKVSRKGNAKGFYVYRGKVRSKSQSARVIFRSRRTVLSIRLLDVDDKERLLTIVVADAQNFEFRSGDTISISFIGGQDRSSLFITNETIRAMYRLDDAYFATASSLGFISDSLPENLWSGGESVTGVLVKE